METISLTKMYKIFLIFVMILLIGVVPSPAKERPDDESISMWVNDALFDDSRVSVDNINVTSKDGIVKLTGIVKDLAAKKYAESEAKKIRGVRGVINEIIVDEPFRYDFDISQDIRQRILNSSSIKSQFIDVSVTNGNVTLGGVVSSSAEADQAQLLAMETKGVKSVRNNLVPSYPEKRSDKEIKKDAQDSLTRDVYLAGFPVEVSVKNGIITLKGKVATAYEKDRAYNDVFWIWNVKDVDNQLLVKGWLKEGARKKAEVPTDEQLGKFIKDELSYDSRITTPDKIKVDAAGGNVTLSGSVPTFYQKRIAKMDALNVIGTAIVTNYLTVKERARSDISIQNDILTELDADYSLNLEGTVKTRVNNGIVTLTGSVANYWDKAHAYDVVSRVNGVRDVINNIKVNYLPEYTDASLSKRIRNRLNQNAETMFISKDIKVEVNHGKATLSGSVNLWSEYAAAANIVFNTPGVWEVVNKLIVNDYDYKWNEFMDPLSGSYKNNNTAYGEHYRLK